MPSRVAKSPARSRVAKSPARSRVAKSPARSRPVKSELPVKSEQSPVAVKLELPRDPCAPPSAVGVSGPHSTVDRNREAILAGERAVLAFLAESEKRYYQARGDFVKKVFGLVTTQLVATALICAAIVTFDTSRQFILTSPNLLLLACLGSFGLLAACHSCRYQYPENILCLAAFTANEAYVLSFICSAYYADGFGSALLIALGLTSLTTVGLTTFALRSKKDFSFLAAGLYVALWALILAPIIGSVAAWLLGVGNILQDNLAFGVAGALLFSLYIVFDVWLISKRLPFDDCVHGAICLYLDIVNLFLDILRIVVKAQGQENK